MRTRTLLANNSSLHSSTRESRTRCFKSTLTTNYIQLFIRWLSNVSSWSAEQIFPIKQFSVMIRQSFLTQTVLYTSKLSLLTEQLIQVNQAKSNLSSARLGDKSKNDTISAITRIDLKGLSIIMLCCSSISIRRTSSSRIIIVYMNRINDLSRQ